MAAKDAADRNFRDRAGAARRTLQRCLDNVLKEWGEESLSRPYRRFGPELTADLFHDCIKAGFREFWLIGKGHPSKITNPVNWARGHTSRVLKANLYPKLEGRRFLKAAFLEKLLGFLEHLADKQTLREPSPDERSGEQTRGSDVEKRKMAAIKKVSEPDKNRFLRTDEAAAYFDCSERTIVSAGLEGSQSGRFESGPGGRQVAPRHTTAPTA